MPKTAVLAYVVYWQKLGAVINNASIADSCLQPEGKIKNCLKLQMSSGCHSRRFIFHEKAISTGSNSSLEPINNFPGAWYRDNTGSFHSDIFHALIKPIEFNPSNRFLRFHFH
jgi:hypothetical protein